MRLNWWKKDPQKEDVRERIHRMRIRLGRYRENCGSRDDPDKKTNTG